jgi:hypothetical protein
VLTWFIQIKSKDAPAADLNAKSYGFRPAAHD